MIIEKSIFTTSRPSPVPFFFGFLTLSEITTTVKKIYIYIFFTEIPISHRVKKTNNRTGSQMGQGVA